MAKILISFLGAGNEKRVYRSAKYKLGEFDSYETTFISDYLIRSLKPHKTIIIGTVRSMWEEVYKKFAVDSKKRNADIGWDEIFRCICNSNYDSDLSNFITLTPYFEDIHTSGSEIVPVLIKYGLNDEELLTNTAIILNLEKQFHAGDEIYIDITHAFRSIPVYALILLQYLKEIPAEQSIIIKDIFYGMLDATNDLNLGYTPVISLKSLEGMFDWIKAVHAFTHYHNSNLLISSLQKLEMPQAYLITIRKWAYALQMNDSPSLTDISSTLVQQMHILNTEDNPNLLPFQAIKENLLRFPTMFRNEPAEWKRLLLLARQQYNSDLIGLAIVNIWEAIISRFESIFGKKVNESRNYYGAYRKIITGVGCSHYLNSIAPNFTQKSRRLKKYRDAIAHAEQATVINYGSLNPEVKNLLIYFEQTLPNNLFNNLAKKHLFEKYFDDKIGIPKAESISILNAPVITTEGNFRYSTIPTDEVKELILTNGFTSYIGHQSTCDILSKLLGVNILLNRSQYFQETGNKAIIFRLKTRTSEGVVLSSIEEIEQHGYEFGILEKTG